MEKLFLSVLNMSITASYVILFVMLVRLLLKKAPKLFSYALWGVVLIRLVCPFSIAGVFSLIPISTQTVPQDIMYQQSPQIDSGIVLLDRAISGALPAPMLGDSMNPLQLWIALGAAVWLCGIAALLLYSTLTTVRLAFRLKASKPVSGNIYEINGIKSPFVFGFFRPKIYLPQSLTANERDYILTHEQTHIKRFDHIIKPCAFLVLCAHWFNPLVWIAFFLMGEDMEFSCDESVIKQLGSDIKKDYSISLLSLSTGRRIVGGCPLAFGENNTKGRIKNILHYKKPAFWVIILVAVVLSAVAIGLMANPADKVSPAFQKPSVAADEMTEAEITELANRLMSEAETVFWWYHSDLSDGLEIDLDAEPLNADGQEWQRVGKFETMAQLKASTEAVFTLDFCKANFYDKIEKLGKFKEIDGVLYHNGNVGGMGWIYSLPKMYNVQSTEKNKIVLTAVCDGLNPDTDGRDTIEYKFGLTLIRDSSGWKVSSYYNYTLEGYSGDMVWVDKAFPVPAMDAEQQMYNDNYIRPILLTGLLWQNWGEGDYAAISPDPINNPQADYLMLAFEDLTGMEKMREIFSTYSFNLPEQVVEEVLLSRFPFTADQLHKILAFYYRPEEKVYYYESGRGGGPIECAVTDVKDNGSGTVVLQYVTLVGYYDEGLPTEQEAYLYKRHGTLTLKQANDGSYRYWSVRAGLEEEARPE